MKELSLIIETIKGYPVKNLVIEGNYIVGEINLEKLSPSFKYWRKLNG